MSPLRLVQFTDMHLYGSDTESLRGVQTVPALAHTLAQARTRDWPVDAILVTGDIVQDVKPDHLLTRFPTKLVVTGKTPALKGDPLN